MRHAVTRSQIPQPNPLPIVGNALNIDADAPVQSMMKLAAEYGPIFRLTFPKQQIHLVSSHALVRELCDEARFEKHLHGPLREIRALAGDGLFTAETKEPSWGKAHRILMPAFSPLAMRNYFDDMLDIAEQLFTRWERFGPEHVIDVADDMTRLTLDTIALSAFSFRFNSFYREGVHAFVGAMVGALKESGERSRRVPLQTRLMLLTQQQYASDIQEMHALADEIIARRKAVPAEAAPRDLLGLMLNAKDPETGETLTAEQIRYQLVTFLIAGHETTSGLLSFATYALLQNPDVLARAREEVDQVFGGERPRFEQISQLRYLDAVLRETLRLWPTAPAFGVHALSHTVLGGRYPIEMGDILLALLPTLHRDPAVWTEPERFNPDRFLDGERERIPDRAWLPFGNGQRSCIGRAFALQEATLVLAMMLQRFEIAHDAPYALQIKETLTLKPEGLKIQARVRTPSARPAAATPVRATTPTQVPALKSHGTKLLVLFGSNSGTSEAFARKIAGDGSARGYAVQVAPLDDFAGKLPKDAAVVIVTASYNGKPPDNARRFAEWLETLEPNALEGVRYSVFGCGNRDWAATYQAVPSRFDGLLQRAGASPLVGRGEADARADFFGDFERWYTPFWDEVSQKLGVSAERVNASALYECEILSPSGAELAKQNKLQLATVVENRELVDLSSPLGRSKRHLELALPEGVTYAAGDYLAVLPENHPDLVDRAARRFGLRTDASLQLKSTRGSAATSLPTDRPISVAELLSRYVELSAPATRKDVERLSEKNRCQPHRDHLIALAKDPARYKAEVLEKRVSVLDLVEKYASIELSFAEFLELLPAMRVRQYSISSSPLANEARCSLTVAIVDAPAWSGAGRFHGTASSYLARLREGDKVAIAVRAPNHPFRPPESNETPMVMICAGTGLAPFRGFIQERAARKARGEVTGEALLFFGCDHPEVDFLYRAELAEAEAAGAVSVLPAFFKAPRGEISFVQHRLWEERARVSALLDAGATLFVCGDGLRMAPAVRDTLARIRHEQVGGTFEEAKAWLEEQERAGRYVADVFA